MRCQRCDDGDAVIQLTKIQNNEMKTVHLCEACAAAEGVESGGPPMAAPLTDFLAQMGKGIAAGMPSTAGDCPQCGLSIADFKGTGRLG
jgi:protein arginine kinase activator